VRNPYRIQPKIDDNEFQRWYTVLGYVTRDLPFFSIFSDDARRGIVNDIMHYVDNVRVKPDA
jgi:hypothetical protein